MGLPVNWVHSQSWEKNPHYIGFCKLLCYLGLPGSSLKSRGPTCKSEGTFTLSTVEFCELTCPLLFCAEMNESSSLLCTLNYSNLINEASMEADTSLWYFFVERKDSSGSVSQATTNQDESDQICLYHIRKSCSFQGKSEEMPLSMCRSASHSWSSALRPSLDSLPHPEEARP